MFKNLLSHCEMKKLNVFDFTPITFVIEVNSVNYAYELDKFITYFTSIDKAIETVGGSQNMSKETMSEVLTCINQKFMNQAVQKDTYYAKRKIPVPHFKAQNIWILKATGFNRGRGIHVFNKLEDLKKLIKEYTDGVNFENQYDAAQKTNKLISKAS